MAYQYLQQLPTIANGSASKLWVLPAELTDAMRQVADGFGTPRQDSTKN
ncbi:MAG: hypothetical protein WAS05_04450 [Candidatus Nanopelagicales bacterium]